MISTWLKALALYGEIKSSVGMGSGSGGMGLSQAHKNNRDTINKRLKFFMTINFVVNDVLKLLPQNCAVGAGPKI
jgi:hypothetical protein